jgi:hypothetical protein
MGFSILFPSFAFSQRGWRFVGWPMRRVRAAAEVGYACGNESRPWQGWQANPAQGVFPSMDTTDITYRIKLDAAKTETFTFRLDGETFDLAPGEVKDAPEWTRLDYRQCSHCPLSKEEHSHCPLALQLHQVVDRFHRTRSIDEVEVEVITGERQVTQKTVLQKAIASMLDLVYPVCGCPKTAFMKPLARFHLPLCSEEETVFRVTGMYLLAQYFLSKAPSRKGRIEFDGLTQIYNDLHILNTAVARRLQSATQSDSAKNAITLIDMYSTLVPLLLEDELAELRGFFKAYLPEGDSVQAMTNYLERAKAFSIDLDHLELAPLESASSGQAKPDDMPQWMKEAKGLAEPAPVDVQAQETEAEPPAPEKDKTPFITSDGFTLELAPLEEKPPKD